MAELLRVSDLQTHYVSFGGKRIVKAVDGVSFTLDDGETLGIVGESGCGKTTTCLSIVGLLPSASRIVGGSIEFAGEDIAHFSPRQMRRVRGAQIAMILQDPMASLNPLFSIYTQVAEPAYYHLGVRGRSLRARVGELLRSVRIPSPAMRMREYPHQMSGGMRQRIVGAIALSGGPKLIIADEPTTNLDVTIQAQYLDLLKDLQQETGVAVIFVTHNLGIVARMCDKLAVIRWQCRNARSSRRSKGKWRRGTPWPAICISGSAHRRPPRREPRVPFAPAQTVDGTVGRKTIRYTLPPVRTTSRPSIASRHVERRGYPLNRTAAGQARG